jgi:hypothetical protein
MEDVIFRMKKQLQFEKGLLSEREVLDAIEQREKEQGGEWPTKVSSVVKYVVTVD